MNELTKFLVESVIGTEFDKPKTSVALFGGGFKPPTKGHLEVVNQGIKQNPEVSKVKILVGGGERNGFTQDQAVKIWNLYNDIGFIDKPATIIPVSSPFTYYKNYLKDNPDDKVYVFIGSRPGEEKDQFDVKQRSEFVKKYSDNVVPVEVATGGGVSGTLARKLFKTDIDGFRNMFPENLLDTDFDKILDILNNKSTDNTRESTPKATEPLTPLNEGDPKKGTGKKPKGSGRRLYTDEDPKDTVGIKFSTRQDIVDTLNKKSFKAKSHARQSQIINLIHQRVRAAYGRANDPAVKKRLKTGLDYITGKKEASKKKTQRLKKQNSKNENIDPKSQAKHKGKAAPFGSAYKPVNEELIEENISDIKNWVKNSLKSLGEKSISVIAKLGKEIADIFNIDVDRPKWSYDYIEILEMLEEYYDDNNANWPYDDDEIYALAIRMAKQNDNERKKLLQQGKITQKDIDYWNDELEKTPSDRNLGYDVQKRGTLGSPLSRINKWKNRDKLFSLTENATYSSKIDYKQQIKDLTKHMIKKGMNILPLPRVIFKHGDQENASQFLGKTAYYSPSDMTVVLYTEGRHPKDIVRSFAHEMVHHIQNLEGRLHDISTTNTMEDDHLNDIEREAYTRGNMVFRNWTDNMDGEEVSSLNEAIVGEKIECDNCNWSWNIVDGGDDLYMCHKCGHDNEPENGDPFGLKAYARELVSEVFKKSVTIDMDAVNAALKNGIFTDKETDENVISIIDAAPQGKVPHPVFLDFYAKYDKYFGEENDERILDEFGLKQILTNVLNLPNEDIQIVLNHYETEDKAVDNDQWYERHDNELEKDEEHTIPGFDDANDDYESVVNYRKQQLAKSLEEQERVRIFNPNCGCDKT